MIVDIPDSVIKKLIASYLPSEHDLGLMVDNSRLELRNLVTSKVIERMGEIELPVISKEELKQAVLARMAERAIERMEND